MQCSYSSQVFFYYTVYAHTVTCRCDLVTSAPSLDLIGTALHRVALNYITQRRLPCKWSTNKLGVNSPQTAVESEKVVATETLVHRHSSHSSQ